MNDFSVFFVADLMPVSVMIRIKKKIVGLPYFL